MTPPLNAKPMTPYLNAKPMTPYLNAKPMTPYLNAKPMTLIYKGKVQKETVGFLYLSWRNADRTVFCFSSYSFCKR